MVKNYWINNPIGQKVDEFTATPFSVRREFQMECNRLGIRNDLCTYIVEPVLSYEVEIDDDALAMVKQ